MEEVSVMKKTVLNVNRISENFIAVRFCAIFEFLKLPKKFFFQLLTTIKLIKLT